MSKMTTTCPVSWRGSFQITIAVAVFFMVDPYIRKLLSLVQEYCIAELSPNWFGTFIIVLVVYCFYLLLGRYRNTYIPVQLRWGLLLLALAYLYYRISPTYYYRLSPEFYFWQIPLGDWTVFHATWTDLLFLPWLYVMGGRGIWLKANGVCMRRVEDKPQEKKTTSSNISDPIEYAEDDELDFNPKVSELAKELRGLDLRGRSTCYGIIAPWGYGKTSFLNLLSKNLSSDGIVVAFNPRSAKNVEHIQADFFTKLAQELSRYYWGASLIVSRYAEQIGLLNHYSKVRLLADVLRLFRTKGDKATVSTAIDKIGKRLYIILDDLDRLEGKELLETIKLIDITASFKNTVFLVACDKKYANDVLQEYLGANPGQGYLDKYITREIQLSEYINENLAKLMARYLENEVGDGELVTRQDVLDEWSDISHYIVPHLATCRHLKRYFNLFLEDFQEVQDYVDPSDFFLLSLLKYKDKTVYDAVKYRIQFTGNKPFFSPYPLNTWGRFSHISGINIYEINTNISLPMTSGERMYSQHLSEQMRPIAQIAQWEGAAMVLWLLFEENEMVGEEQLSTVVRKAYWRLPTVFDFAIRHKCSFSSYFPDLVDKEREVWHKDVLSLIKCRDKQVGQEILDRYYERDKDTLIRLLSNRMGPHFYPGEDRAVTLMLVAYIADRYNISKLKQRLRSCFTSTHYVATCARMRCKINFSENKCLLDRILDDMEAHYPMLVCEILEEVVLPSKEFYIYKKEEASERILKSLGLIAKSDGIDVVRYGEIINKFLCTNSIFMFKESASLITIKWVEAHPNDSFFMLVSLDIDEESNKIRVQLRDSVAAMQQVGFSVKDWMNRVDDPRIKSVFRAIRFRPDGVVVESSCLAQNRQLSISLLYDAFIRDGLILRKS